MAFGNAGFGIPPQTENTPARGITVALEDIVAAERDVEREHVVDYLRTWIRLAIKSERLVLASELISIMGGIQSGDHWATEVKQVNNEELWR